MLRGLLPHARLLSVCLLLALHVGCSRPHEPDVLAIVTKAANLNKHIDTNIVLRGKLQGNEQPSVLGVHLSLDDFECEEMFGEQVECHGKLRRKEVAGAETGETQFVLERLVKISVIK